MSRLNGTVYTYITESRFIPRGRRIDFNHPNIYECVRIDNKYSGNKSGVVMQNIWYTFFLSERAILIAIRARWPIYARHVSSEISLLSHATYFALEVDLAIARKSNIFLCAARVKSSGRARPLHFSQAAKNEPNVTRDDNKNGSAEMAAETRMGK